MDKFFDNLKKGVSIAVSEAEKFTKVVADKTTGLVDTTKLNLSLSDTEKKMNKLYVSIGEAVYDGYKNGDETFGEFAEICGQIAEFEKEAALIREQLAELKSSACCPSCGQMNAKESDYCSKCGAKLSENDSDGDMVIEVTDFPED